MSRRLRPASTVLIAAAAFAVGAAPAAADVEIPLGDAISGQYQVPEAVEAATAIAGAGAESGQYHPEIPSGNSEDVTENVPVPSVAAPAEPAEPPTEAPVEPRDDAPVAPVVEPPAAPRDEPPAAAPAEPRDEAPTEPRDEPAVDTRAPAGVEAPVIPSADLPVVALGDAGLGDEVPVEAPLELSVELADEPPVEGPVPDVPAPASNINVSIRIFSPGDNGPVTQTTGGGGGGSDATPAPTTWIWNWTWTGAPACDPGAGANAAPAIGVAEWTWNWVWTCGEDATDPPFLSELPQLPSIAVGTGELLPAIPLPALVPLPALPEVAGLELPLEPLIAEPRSERETTPPERAIAAGALAPAPPAPPPAAPPEALAPPASQPAADRAPARHRGRDTTRRDGAISAHEAPIGAPLVAVAGAAAAAGGAGSGPADLVMLVSLLACFLAGALLAAPGLPRLLLRASRLERPG
jgi:hypothetical protein